MKKNIRKFGVLIICLFCLGLSGFFIGLVEVDRTYSKNKENINILVNEVMRLDKTMENNAQKLEQYAFMEYKVNAFAKRYALYSDILDAVYKKSSQYGFEPELVLGIVQVESNFNPSAVSYVGAVGLMQVNLPVWRNELSIDDDRVFDVEYNIDLGLQILKRYYDEVNGNLKMALHLYNNGYKYNNTSYADKVGSAVMAFKPGNLSLTVAGGSAYGR